MRLIVCSNSAPRLSDGPDGAAGARMSPRTPGGLVPLLVALLQQHGGDWICTAPADDPHLRDAPVPLGDGVTLHPVAVSDRVREHHYLTIGVRLMLWLFHYLLDTPREPVFDAGFARAWGDYEAVNQAYAERLRTLSGGSDDEQLLINDYHLFLVPEMLATGPPRRGRVTYFHGLPWCEPQYYAILPPPVRDRILASLLCCDVVGFHSRRWADAFVACCARFLPDARVEDTAVTYRGRRTEVRVTTFPLDTDTIDRLAADPLAATWRERLAVPAAGRRVVARADRLDLWKNHLRGFAAYRALLAEEPELAGQWWFCAVTTTPTRGTERSHAYQQECESVVADINLRYGTAERPAVSLVYPDAVSTRHCVTALLEQAGATVVNPTIDGMNLVAKEALYLAPHAPVLCSVEAGVYEHVADHVTAVQPYDVAGTAAALRAAMGERPVTTPPGRRDDVARLLRGPGPLGWLAGLTEERGDTR